MRARGFGSARVHGLVTSLPRLLRLNRPAPRPGMRRRYVSQAALASMKSGGVALLAALAVFAFAVRPAMADPCADTCRGQHNACRMAAKLLYPARCDAQLQSCISQCFAAGRFKRDREGRDHRGGEFGERRDMRVPPDVRGLPEGRGLPDPRGLGDGRGPPDMHGPPDMRGHPGDFRDRAGERGGAGRWLGGPGPWERR